MKKTIINKTIYKFIGILLFIFVWFLVSILVGNNAFIIPGPFKTILQMFDLLRKKYVYECIFETMIRMFAGFIISFVLAFVTGVFAGNNEKIEYIFKPSIIAFRSIPTASLVYLFLLIAGAKLTPMFIVILIAFPILYENILNGIKSTPTELIEASLIDNTTLIKLNTKVRIPLAKPYIITGIASSFSLSLKIEIMAEVITGYTRLGIGSAILAAQRSNPTDLSVVFAYSLIAIIIMIICDYFMNYIAKNNNN